MFRGWRIRILLLLSAISVAGILFGEAWELGDAQYLSNQLEISSEETDPKLMFWHPDGSRFFMIGDISDRVHQYNLTIAWDLNTAEYSGISYDFSAEVTDPKGIFFKPDGMKMYLNDCLTDRTYQYSLSVAWDVTTLSYDGVSYHFFDQLTNPKSLYFKPDGSRCYIDCYAHDRIYQYDLSEPWELGSISYNGVSYYFHEIEDQPQQVSFRPDGAVMYLNGSGGNSIYSFALAEPWDVSTAEYEETALDICAMNYDHAIRGHHFSPDGHLLYMIGCQHCRISQFRLESAWDISTAYFNNYYSYLTEEGDAQNLSLSSDGSRLYLQGYTHSEIFQYDLSIPWDVRSAQYSEICYDFSAQEINPRGMYMKPDGSKMYISGSDSDRIWQYSLESAWDLSTAVFDNVSLNVGFQDNNSRDIFMKPDGSRLYMSGANHCVYQYTLGEPWDISTAVYDNINHYTNGQTYNEKGIFIDPEGVKLYLVSASDDVIYQYDLTEPWEISSMEYNGVNMCMHCYEGDARDVFFSEDGSRMYFQGKGADKVYQFTLEMQQPPVNYPPEIDLPEEIEFNEDSGLEIDFSDFLYDVEGDAITLCSNGGDHVDVEIDSFMVTFCVEPNWNGEEEIVFGASDGEGGGMSCAAVTVVVLSVNDLPEISSLPDIEMAEDTAETIDLDQYITDVDGDELLVEVSSFEHITTQIEGMQLSLMPEPDWFGAALFELSADDGEEQVFSSFWVEVTAVNDVPEIVLPDSIVFYSDSVLEVDFAEYCCDVDSEELDLSVTGNDQISVEIAGMNVMFGVENNWLGEEEMIFCVEDGETRACGLDTVWVISAPSGKPVINFIEDRPEDQGGYVFINFSASYYDDQIVGRECEFYTVWYESEWGWTALNSVGALGEEYYTVLTVTPADSVGDNSALITYRITAHMEEGSWISQPGEGYSVDNICPAAPENLYVADDILSWDCCVAEDFSYYRVYLNGQLQICCTEASCNIGGWQGEIRVKSVDCHENASADSEILNYGHQSGDVDGNGEVEAYDAALILQYFCIVEPEEFPFPWAEWRIALADVDNNGSIEAFDAALVLRYSLGLIEEYPPVLRAGGR